MSDDGESFYKFDKPSGPQALTEPDGPPRSPPIAVAEIQTLTSKKPLDVKPLYGEDVADGEEPPRRFVKRPQFDYQSCSHSTCIHVVDMSTVRL